MYYSLISTTPLTKILRKDRKAIDIAYSSSFSSDFESRRSLGACIRLGKKYFLCG